jgi:hypothetical protein
VSNIQIQDPVWRAIMADPALANARRKLSFHEIRLIVRHAQGMQLREDSRSEAEAEGLQPGPARDAPDD